VCPSKLETAGEKTEKRLIEIRKSIGASIAGYSVTPVEIDISGAEIADLAKSNPGEPIILNGEYSVVYIKDHNFHGFKTDHDNEVNKHPNRCFVRGNKAHFYYCITLRKMTENGKKKRYRRAIFIDSDDRLIDLRDAQNVNTRLAWCKHCIVILGRTGGVRKWILWRGKNKSRMAEYGDAKDLTECVKMLHIDGNTREATQRTQNFFVNTLNEEKT